MSNDDIEVISRAILAAEAIMGNTAAVFMAVGVNRTQDPEPIQIAAVDTQGRVVVNVLVRPVWPVEDALTAVHGITRDQAASASPFPDVYPRVREAIEGHTVVAFGADRARGCLETACQRHSVPPIEATWECAAQLYALYFGGSPHTVQRFADAVAQMEIVADDPGDALVAADATRRIVWRMSQSFVPRETLLRLAQPVLAIVAGGNVDRPSLLPIAPEVVSRARFINSLANNQIGR